MSALLLCVPWNNIWFDQKQLWKVNLSYKPMNLNVDAILCFLWIRMCVCLPDHDMNFLIHLDRFSNLNSDSHIKLIELNPTVLITIWNMTPLHSNTQACFTISRGLLGDNVPENYTHVSRALAGKQINDSLSIKI